MDWYVVELAAWTSLIVSVLVMGIPMMALWAACRFVSAYMLVLKAKWALLQALKAALNEDKS